MSNNHYKTALLVAASIGAVATDQAAAQDVGEVVVTARRIEERLQDVPISITVFNQEQIDNANVANLSDLATYTPSLQNNSQYGSASTATFSIRGFVQDPFTAPSVGVYFGDVVAPRGASSLATGEGAGPGYMFDLQNVQVLKGPQGTLFGRNTTGGAVLLVPQRPTYDLEGYVEGSVGNFGMNRQQAVLNVPLGDQARLRLGVDRMMREGYITNISDVGPRHFGDVNYIAARASFVIDMTPSLENYSILSYAQSETNGGLAAITECDETNPAGAFLIGRFSCDQTARYAAANDFYAAENAVIDPFNNQYQWQFINTTTWDISDNLTFKNIISYAEVMNDIRGPIFGNSWQAEQGEFGANAGTVLPFGSIQGPGQHFNHSNTFTEEIQFQGTALDSRLTWQAGAYYEAVEQLPPLVGTLGFQFGSCDTSLGFDPDAFTSGWTDPGTPLTEGVTGLPTNVSTACNMMTSFPGGADGILQEVRTSAFYDQAVYAQGTYEITDRLSATLGIRYTDDQSEARAIAHIYPTMDDPSQPGIQPIINEAAIECADPRAVLPTCERTFSQHSNATTGEFDLEYSASDNLNLYAKYARGYRQGMVNPRGFDFLSSFDQEQVDLYEVGAKANWGGSFPGYANISIFHNDFQNQQLGISYIGEGSPASGICSCGESDIDGVELDGAVTLFEGFRLSGGVAYLKTDLISYPFNPVGPDGWPVPSPGANVDLPLAFSPEWKGALTAAYTLPLSENIGELTLSATYSYIDDYYLREDVIPSYSLLNLNLNWDEVFGSPVDLSVFGTNVTDEEYFTTINRSLLPQFGSANGVTGEPAMYGVRLRYNFGDE
jgi:iron complex outermembrane receptor protein